MTPSDVASAVALPLVWSDVAKPGIVNARMSRARPAQAIHRPGGDDQGVGGVQAPGDADHDLRLADRPQPLLQAGHLDVVRLVAVLGEPGRVRRDEREPRERPPQAEVAVRRRERRR